MPSPSGYLADLDRNRQLHRVASECLIAFRSFSRRRRAEKTGMNFSIALTPESRREAWVAAPGTVMRNVGARAGRRDI